MSLTPNEPILRPRLAAHIMYAQGKTNTAPVRKAFMARFEDKVEPDRLASRG